MGRHNPNRIYPTITFPEICRKLGLNARQRVSLIRYYKEVIKMDEEEKVETPEVETDVEEEKTEESAETEATPGTESEE